jgi:predicted Zn-dependent peptidase
MRQLINYVERGIDNVTSYEQVVKAQTSETVAAFARQLKASNKVEVIMTPAK